MTKPNRENCKNCSSKCSYDCAQLQYTIQHRTVLTILPLTSRNKNGILTFAVLSFATTSLAEACQLALILFAPSHCVRHCHVVLRQTQCHVLTFQCIFKCDHYNSTVSTLPTVLLVRLVLRWVTMSGFNSRCGTFISVCNQPPRSTQPGHPFVGIKAGMVHVRL